ncbi:hypothetical protein ACFQ1I_05900 [Kitasatospora arboriphila]
MNDGAATVIGWDEVRALIAARLPGAVIERLSGVPADRLDHLRAPLRRLRSELLRDAVSAEANRSFPAHGQLAALRAAGLSAARTPVEALGWLTDRRLRDATWPLADGGSTNADHHALLRVLLEPHRSTAWQRELAVRLAEWLLARGDGPRWLVAHGLTVWSGAEVPATDGYVTGWLREGGLMRHHHREIAEWFADQGLREPVPHHDTLLSWLRAQPRLAEFVRGCSKSRTSEASSPIRMPPGPDPGTCGPRPSPRWPPRAFSTAPNCSTTASASCSAATGRATCADSSTCTTHSHRTRTRSSPAPATTSGWQPTERPPPPGPPRRPSVPSTTGSLPTPSPSSPRPSSAAPRRPWPPPN